MLSEDGPAIGVAFAKSDGPHSGSFEAKAQPSDATEEICDAQLHKLTSCLVGQRGMCNVLQLAHSGARYIDYLSQRRAQPLIVSLDLTCHAILDG